MLDADGEDGKGGEGLSHMRTKADSEVGKQTFFMDDPKIYLYSNIYSFLLPITQIFLFKMCLKVLKALYSHELT